jgi:hypothetical protein
VMSGLAPEPRDRVRRVCRLSRVRHGLHDPRVEAPGRQAARPQVRVLVLTAPVGEGHVAAARTLAEDILRGREGAEVIVCDALPALRRPLRWLLSDAYRWQLRSAPWLFGLLFGALRRSRMLRSLARAGLSLAGSRGCCGWCAAIRRM